MLRQIYTEQEERQLDETQRETKRRDVKPRPSPSMRARAVAARPVVDDPVTREIVKGAMASYVFEHMEIASYTSLMAAAQQAGDVETQRVCEQILAQEQAMAQWLLDNIPEVTQTFMARDATDGVEAKK